MCTFVLLPLLLRKIKSHIQVLRDPGWATTVGKAVKSWVQWTIQTILDAGLPDHYMVNGEKVSWCLHWALVAEGLNVVPVIHFLPSFSVSCRSQWSPCCPYASFIMQSLINHILKTIWAGECLHWEEHQLWVNKPLWNSWEKSKNWPLQKV